MRENELKHNLHQAVNVGSVVSVMINESVASKYPKLGPVGGLRQAVVWGVSYDDRMMYDGTLKVAVSGGEDSDATEVGITIPSSLLREVVGDVEVDEVFAMRIGKAQFGMEIPLSARDQLLKQMEKDQRLIDSWRGTREIV